MRNKKIVGIEFPKSKTVVNLWELTDDQREALRIIIDHRALWQYPNNLLEMYGLYDSRDELREFLKRHP